MKNLAEMILASSIRHATRPLINHLPYNAIPHQTKKYNWLMDRYHVKKSDRVCLLADKCLDWVSIMASCWSRGSVFVPLDKKNPTLNEHILRTVRPKLVLTDTHVQEESTTFTTSGMTTISPILSTHDPALILFTSGTTHAPKGVVLSHHNILSNLSMIDGMYANEVSSSDVSYSILPWHHCYGLVCELLFLVRHGASIHTPSSSIPEKVFKEIRTHQPTMFFAVPKILETIYKKDVRFVPSMIKRNLVFGNRIRMMSVGGALCNPRLISFMMEKFGVPTYQGYGMTETSPMVSLCTPTHNKIGSVGKPMMEVRFAEDGSILVRGDNVMKGYYGFDPLQEEDWFNTGDRGYLSEDGYLFVQGRLKTEYKLSNGKYVDPVYVESLLSLVPGIDQVVVHGEGMPHNSVLIFSKENKRFTLQQLGNILRDRVQGHEIPQVIDYAEEPFTLQNGLLTQKMEPHRQKILQQYKLV